MAIGAMAGGDWRELLQAAFIGLLFSFLVAKLISTVLAFREDGLRISRHASITPDAPSSESPLPPQPTSGLTSVSPEPDQSDESDWEGVESTELDEEFSAASAFVAANSASAKVPEEKLLQLYGLYKIATEGPCTAPQPSALQMKARAKWNAWNKLRSMSPEDAMQNYILIVDEVFPSWATGSRMKQKDEDVSTSNSDAKGATMGPVFSSFSYEGELGNELDDGIHIAAREGTTSDVLKVLENGVSVNLRDAEGRTPLHWAVDRGHLSVVEVLLNANADVSPKDNDGQTPLHYAAICDRKDIAELLVKHHADCNVKDNDGKTPCDLCSSVWSFMTSS